MSPNQKTCQAQEFNQKLSDGLLIDYDGGSSPLQAVKTVGLVHLFAADEGQSPLEDLVGWVLRKFGGLFRRRWMRLLTRGRKLMRRSLTGQRAK